MRLLLHACCAPCSTSVIEKLQPDFNLALYFFNPNIHPEKEYLFRKREIINYAAKVNIPVYDDDYLIKEWFAQVKGKERYPEKIGIRCALCIYYRLDRAAAKAKSENFDLFTTTLTVSPHKNAKMINGLGKNIERRTGMKYLKADFKKQDGYKRSIEMSAENGMYRQDYCGCVYSMLERKNVR